MTLSQALGTMMARRLPTQQTREWRKVLQVWDEAAAAEPAEGQELPAPDKPPSQPVLDVTWPIETVLLPYPGKRTYGQGEVILWELKLLGDSADHGLFLEMILPAMEEAASTTDPQWHRANSLWGRFDIQAVYVARGARWEPLVSEGHLDTRYRASPTQWAEGLTFGLDSKRHFRQLTWITPFDLERGSGGPPDAKIQSDEVDLSGSPDSVPRPAVPTLQDILDALMDRMALFLPGKKRTAQDAWALLSPDEQAAIAVALQQVEPHYLRQQTLKPAPRGWPGRWIGFQTFTPIPSTLLPYLELASILHVGRHTHFGCGTFILA